MVFIILNEICVKGIERNVKIYNEKEATPSECEKTELYHDFK